MIFISIILAFILLLFIVQFFFNKRKRNKKSLIENKWGKRKKEYFDFNNISKYFNKTQNKYLSKFQIIEDREFSDLDLEELFKYIDRTTSKIGQQFLYYKMRTISSIDNLNNFSKLSDFFINNDSIRLEFQMNLIKLSSFEAYSLEGLINNNQIDKPKYLKFIYFLSAFVLLLIIAAFFNLVFLLPLIFVFTFNIFFHYKNKEIVSQYIDAVNQLKLSLAISKKFASYNEIKTHFKDLSFIKNINSIKFKMNFINFEKTLNNNEFIIIIWFIFEIIKVMFNIEFIVFYLFIDSLIKEKDNIDKLFQFIGEIDTSISVASLKSGNNLVCKPNFTLKNMILSQKIYHPLIINCVANDLNISEKSMLLTGSNMSGKTSFIKTIAINSLMAQTLNFCFAENYLAPFFKIFSSINIVDSLMDNTSYYLKEVAVIKRLLEFSESNSNCLFVIDEIFKGTNTTERIAAGYAILLYLNKLKNFVFVSTHDIELADLLKTNGYDLYHFNEKVENNKLRFDYKLKKGKVKTKNAIKILEINKYPKVVIKNAKKELKKLS